MAAKVAIGIIALVLVGWVGRQIGPPAFEALPEAAGPTCGEIRPGSGPI